ncbi:catalase/peroxidase HPI [Synechococcus sp. BS56D]|uniref:catalase/peroxidase HPI n=1 Tax=Synechococcus sp. BS56D TaxID=2055944 RepID=UPI00103B5726|nr:catalase/peroxidase HPI [Synechococcus sp. BS56D]TCD58741.1 catalase/peroxidase HPI [Synechococcus sp. BS56D]
MSDLKCPFSGHTGATTPSGGTTNAHWWPDQINLSLLHQHHPASNPLGAEFNYADAFSELDLEAVKHDLQELMTDSQDWWPADWGHYGALFIRMAWHSAGTYRMADGRGGAGHGNQRFAPLNSWPDNTNLDKARRLIWPIKRKYGNRISWADLIILTGNVALESMGFRTFGFAGGRTDIWQPEDDVFWGKETTWLGDERHAADGQLNNPLAAVEMGLIYVNPEGPEGHPDPVASGREVRETFARMGMTVEETVALVAGGHTFGKCHGAAAADHLEAEPEGAGLEEQGLGWRNRFASGKAEHTITSGIEGAWKPNPTRWDLGYFEMMFSYEWELSKSPAGAWQWVAKDVKPHHMIPDAHVHGKSSAPIMTTADLSLRHDPIMEPIARRFHQDQGAFADTFARAWFKLTHRDLGPRALYLGPDVPEEVQIWQDPVPAVNHPLIDDADISNLKRQILASGQSISALVATAWASASTFRGSDRRGGANGGRIRLLPQRTWEVNDPEQLNGALAALEAVQTQFNSSSSNGKSVSIADLIVLGGCAAVEKAAADGGHTVVVPFHPGRTDAGPEQTDTASFNALKPLADGFRNWQRNGLPLRAEELLIDKAQLLTLSAPEMTVLLAGLRVLGANTAGNRQGVFTQSIGVLSNDFCVNLLDMTTHWTPTSEAQDAYLGRDSTTGAERWTASRADLVFGSNSQLRAIVEVYAQNDGGSRFIRDFVKAWVKVMELDRFDLR